MGCFNVSCGVSGVSMETDAMVLLPLIPVRFQEPLTSAHLVSNIPCCVLFQPFTLPLFGIHDTYGRLASIERDWNVEAIEGYFHLEIVDFMAHFVTFHDEEKQDVLPVNACGMYVHRSIWDVCTTSFPTEFGEARTMMEFPSLPRFFKGHKLWNSLYNSYATDVKYLSSARNFSVFLDNLCAVNKFLMPTINAYQHGNYYAEKILHEVALNLIHKKIARLEEDYVEDNR